MLNVANTDPINFWQARKFTLHQGFGNFIWSPVSKFYASSAKKDLKPKALVDRDSCPQLLIKLQKNILA